MKHLFTMLTGTKLKVYLLIALSLPLSLRLTLMVSNAQQAPQSPDAPGVITGILTNSAGTPLAGIVVSLYRDNEALPRTVMTDATGAFRFGLLSAGIYQLAFRDPAEHYALQFYGGAPVAATATDIVVGGQVVTVAPVSLVAGSRITGTITNRMGAPLGQITIRAFVKLQNQWRLVVEKWLTEVPQPYSLGGLPAGVFHLCAGNYSVTECYPDIVADNTIESENVAYAQDIALAVGQQRTNVDFVLGDSASRGEISGYVTDTAGAPIARITVNAYYVREGTPPTFALAKTGETDSAGYYRLPYLHPSLYVIVFRDTETHRYAEQYYSQADSLRTAHPLTITAGSQGGPLNTVMTLGGQMVGQVRVAGEVVNEARLWFYRQSADGWQEQGSDWVDDSGIYTATGLPAGLYRVEGEVRLDGGWSYRGYHGGLTPESAATIQVTAGVTLSQDLDMVITPDLFAGVISGTVRSAGQPQAGIQVEAISQNSGKIILYTTSDQQGRYQMAGLPNGGYYLRFFDPAEHYAASWYSSQWPEPAVPVFSKDKATPVIIEGATVARDIDGMLVRAGAIQGQVRTASGDPVMGIIVCLFAADDPSGWFWPSCYADNRYPPTITTDQQGRYQMGGLPPGRYHVGFFYDIYVHEGRYYPLSQSLNNAGDVVVQAGTITTGIDGIVGPLPQIFLPFVAQ